MILLNQISMQKRNVLNSPRLLELKKHRQRVFQKKIALGFFSFVILITSLVYVSRLSAVNIYSIEVVGNKVIETNTIKEIVQNELTGKYLKLFPKTNLFLYPENNIKNTLSDKFKRLKDIQISIKNKKTLEIMLIERTGVYTWCGDVLPLLDSTGEYKCYFIDDTGYLFDEAPYFSGSVYFRFFGTIDKKENPLGLNFLPGKFANLISLKTMLEDMNLKPSAFYLNNMGEINVFFSTHSMLPDGPVFLLKADADFNKVAENLKASLNTEPLKTDFKKKYSSLQYIDLRFGNKVYFKFK